MSSTRFDLLQDPSNAAQFFLQAALQCPECIVYLTANCRTVSCTLRQLRRAFADKICGITIIVDGSVTCSQPVEQLLFCPAILQCLHLVF
mmetsp:Transcript_686/g.1331  ORF Transcript_686/g.1331 Transcript_686/m.1331 type:complete len:90 (+) Transcript_686:332-601(+)